MTGFVLPPPVPAVMVVAGLLLGRLAAADPGWQELAPEAFAARPEVLAPIDFEPFDAPLMSAAIFHATNRVRRELGLPVFTHLAKLDDAADLKAAFGVVEGVLRHENPLPMTATPADRVQAVGLDYRQVAENIAQLGLYELPEGQNKLGLRRRGDRMEYYHLDTGLAVETRSYAGFAEATVTAWMNSPPHRANIVDPGLRSLGCAARPCRSLVGRHEQVYAVQVFFTPR